MNAKDVIKIGRRRVRAACTAASRGCALFFLLSREFDNQDRVFGGQATSTTKPICARMSIGKPRACRPLTEARRHIGTIRTIAIGNFQLSY